MKINEIEVNAKWFAYDGCHKIYTIKNKRQMKDAENHNYTIYPIELIENVYQHSCGLKFISSWDLKKHYVRQFEKAVFEVA